MDNVLDLIGTLNTTYPQEFGEIADKLEACDLDKELQNVRSSLWQEPWNAKSFHGERIKEVRGVAWASFLFFFSLCLFCVSRRQRDQVLLSSCTVRQLKTCQCLSSGQCSTSPCSYYWELAVCWEISLPLSPHFETSRFSPDSALRPLTVMLTLIPPRVQSWKWTHVPCCALLLLRMWVTL